MQAQEGDSDDHGDTVETATSLTVGRSVAGYIDVRDEDKDYFRLDVRDNDIAVLAAAHNSHPTGRLLDESGVELELDTDYPSLDTFLIRRRLEKGVYFVEVSGSVGRYAVAAVKDGKPDIPGAALRNALARQLREEPESITNVDMAALTALPSSNTGIEDLSGLDAATSLMDLFLRSNDIEDISVLSSMKLLYTVHLGSNRIADIAPLSHLPALEGLQVENNEISDLSSLAGLPELERVDVGGNQVEDLSPLLSLPRLSRLVAGLNPLGDESVSEHIPALRERGVEVYLAEDDFGSDPRSAAHLPLGEGRPGRIDTYYDHDYFRVEVPRTATLDFATIGHGPVVGRLVNADGFEMARSDGEGWNFLIRRRVAEGVYYLVVAARDDPATYEGDLFSDYIVGADVDAVDVEIPDRGLHWSIELAMEKSGGRDTFSAAEMMLLTTLWGSFRDIRDLTGLEFATALTSLSLANNKIRDISPLANLVDLTSLSLDDNEITDISPLLKLTGLTWLTLDGNRISDISALEGMTKLRYLDLAGNRVSDISLLANMPLLEELLLGGNEIEDLSPLLELTELRRLDVRNNPLNEKSVDVHLPALEGRGVVVVPSQDDHGDGRETATTITLDETVKGEIRPYYDEDYFRLDLTAATDLTVKSFGHHHVTGRLLDEGGAEIASSNIGGGEASFHIRHDLDAGTYYIEVSSDRRRTAFYSIRAAADVVDVDIPDDELRERLESRLGKRAGETITSIEMASLTRFGVYRRGVVDLTGLEFATGLVDLSLNDNEIVDIGPLSGLTNLSRLTLTDNPIEDLSPLAGLTGLTKLNMDRLDVVDIAPLAGLTSLEGLGAKGNQIVDLSPLANLAALTGLRLDGNRIVDISPVASLTLLDLLTAVGNLIEDITPLLDLHELTEADLRNNPLNQDSIDIHGPALEARSVTVRIHDDHGNDTDTATPVAGGIADGHIYPDYDQDYFRFDLHATTEASIYAEGPAFTVGHLFDENGIELGRSNEEGGEHDFRIDRTLGPGTYFVRVRAIERLGGPYTLHVAIRVDSQFADQSLLEAVRKELGKPSGESVNSREMRRLTSLTAFGMDITDLAGLEYATALESLSLSDNRIVDLSPVAGLAQLAHLDLGENAIVDISPLAGLARLETLLLSHNNIVDLAGLETLTGLTDLRLGDNRIADLSPLGALAALESLVLSDNRISDLSPLAGLVKLRSLLLVRNSISDVAPLGSLAKLEILRLDTNLIAEIAPLLGLTELRQLDLRRNRLDEQSMDVHVPVFVERGVEVGVNDDHGDLRVTATPVEFSEVMAGDFEVFYDTDFFRFELEQETNGAIFTTGNVNTWGQLFDEAGSRLDSNAGAGHVNFLIERQFDPGVYYIGVQPELFRGQADGPYTIRIIENVYVAIADAGLSAGIAWAFGKGGGLFSAGQLGRLGYLDVSNRHVVNLSGLEHAVGLRALIANDNDIVDISPLLGLTELRLVDLRRNPLSDESVDSHVPALAARGVAVVRHDDHGDTTGTATALALGTMVRGQINPSYENDHFRLDVTATTEVRVFTTGDLDTVGRLFSEDGLIADDHSSGNFRIGRRLDPGTYYVRVDSAGDSIGEYTVHAAVVPVSAPMNVHVASDGTHLVVTWSGIDSLGILGYRVVAAPLGGGAPLTCRVGSEDRRCELSVAKDVVYVVEVQAIGDGGDGPFSTGIDAVVKSRPPDAEPMRSFWRGWRLALLPESAAGEPGEAAEP